MGWKSWSDMKEGDVFNATFQKMFFDKNQTILMAVCGEIGTGKSYASIRIAELWYQKHFNRQFPLKNIVFSPEELIDLLLNGKLEKGELIVYEEAGTTMGALEFQTKVAKAFNYVIQSFRSMNIGIIMNYPYYELLNKTTRKFIKFRLQTLRIKDNKVFLDPMWSQINEINGEQYFHPFKLDIGGYWEICNFVSYSKPSEYILEPYENKKAAFLKTNLTEQLETVSNKEPERWLTDNQRAVIALWRQNIYDNKEIAARTGISHSHVCDTIRSLAKKGWFKPQETY